MGLFQINEYSFHFYDNLFTIETICIERLYEIFRFCTDLLLKTYLNELFFTAKTIHAAKMFNILKFNKRYA